MSDTRRPPDESRVLLLAPTGRDAEASRGFLSAAGIDCALCRSLDAVCHELEQSGAGAVVLPEEAVQSESGGRLACLVAAQPVWSDLPVVLLSRGGSESAALAAATRSLGNVTVIERPIRVSTLVSVVRTALRARERQYQIRDHIASERAARGEAERASHTKDEFLATLSHELRTPLNAILGWSQILRSGPPTGEDLAEGLAVIERNARAQTQIIEDLLDMSRIISGKVRLDVQRVDLASVVRAAAETVSPAANAKGIRMQSVLDPLAGPVAGDPNRLQQVFWNLLSNSVKFTPKGGRVQVLLGRINSHLEVSVTDTGEGIKPEFLPHVFDRFRQADATTTRIHGGLGLGLAIVKQLVELHGGTVRVASEGPGRGATFTVSLPLTALQVDPPPAEGERRHPRAGPPLSLDTTACLKLKGLRVLVVDDEPDARGLVRRLLEDCDAAVRTAASAAEAVALVEAEPPDVIISDIGMPQEDGYSLIRRVRGLGAARGGDVPALALTAYARADDRVRAIRAGYQLHLPKPVEPVELITMVASLAGRTGAIQNDE